MPTPHLSRTPSGPCSVYPNTEQLDESNCPIDWDTNVVNFISNCLHPGLVRRTSSAAAHAPDSSRPFRKQHRRNLSSATTVGFGRYPDIQNYGSRLPYSRVHHYISDYPANYKHVPGHTRNISDPTSGWNFRTIIRPVIGLDQLEEKPYHDWPNLTRQLSPETPDHKCVGPKINNVGDSKLDIYPFPIQTPIALTISEKSIEVYQKDDFGDTGQIAIERTHEDEACLCGCLQFCANSCAILIGLCLIMFMQTMVVSGLMSSMFTTLEKRFNLTTGQIGYIISCYEGAGVITTVIISFLNGRKHNRLRVIGLATLILAIGFGLFTIPHFLAGPYIPNNLANKENIQKSHSLNGPICLTKQSSNSSVLIQQSNNLRRFIRATLINDYNLEKNLTEIKQIEQNSMKSILFSIFCIAMLLAGIGASPLYVLAPTYLWDNLTDRQYPIYAALFYSAGGLGPACGFLAGAGFLSVYIDTPLLLPENGLDRNSPLWLGAWWLGMLVCAALTFLVAIPVILFPKRLKVQSVRRSLKNKSSNQNSYNVSSENCTAVDGLKNSKFLKNIQPDNVSSKISINKNTVLNSLHNMNSIRKSNESGIHHSPTMNDSYKHNELSSSHPIPSSFHSDLSHNEQLTQQNNHRMQQKTLQNSSYSNKCKYEPNSNVIENKLRNSFYGAKDNFQQKFKVYSLLLLRVLTNPIWLGVTLTTVVEQSIVAAFLAYAAKYIQNLFHIPAYLASIHTGAVIVPGSLIGVLSGALLMRHFRPPIHRTLGGLCIMIGLTVLTSVILMTIACPPNPIAGLTATYDGKLWPWKYGPGFLYPPNLTAPCNQHCESDIKFTRDYLHISPSLTSSPRTSTCSTTKFNPVCWKRLIIDSNFIPDPDFDGPDQLTFFNPCFAGCSKQNSNTENGGKIYTECACVTIGELNPSGNLPSSSFTNQSYTNQTHGYGQVISGKCDTTCPLYGVFLAMLFLHIICTGILQNPSNVITLSCVSPEDGSLALGLQIFFIRTLAFIPAPIYFGQLFDLACQYRLELQTSDSIHTIHSISNNNNNNNNISINSSALPILSPASSYLSPNLPTHLDNSHSVSTNQETSGACLEYNLEGLPFIWLGTVFALKVISLCGSITTWWLARRRFYQSIHSQNVGNDSDNYENGVVDQKLDNLDSIICNQSVQHTNDKNNSTKESSQNNTYNRNHHHHQQYPYSNLNEISLNKSESSQS